MILFVQAPDRLLHNPSLLVAIVLFHNNLSPSGEQPEHPKLGN